MHGAEAWRSVPGNAGYEVSDHGNVRSVERTVVDVNGRVMHYRGKPLKPGTTGAGRLTVMLGQHNRRHVHHLVLEAFVGPRPGGMVACHSDDDPLNNRLDNLRWDTQRSNGADAVRNGRCFRQRLTVEQAEEIRRRHVPGPGRGRRGGNTRALAREFGIDPAHVHKVSKGQTTR